MQSVIWRVAIIGSGPAGLAAAEIFAHHGHNVTIFERDNIPGGLMNLIPEARFPHSNIEKLVQKVTEKGAKMTLNTPISVPISHTFLQSYDHILIATGTQKARNIECKNGMFAVDFLKSNLRPKNAAIAGGGNTAIDCAVEVINRGGTATLYYRGEKANMRASKHEIHHAEKCGVIFKFNSMPPQNDTHDITIVAVGTFPDLPENIENEKIHVIGDAKIGATDIASAMRHAKQVASSICHGHFSNSGAQPHE
jgi:NADPH-dependent glutamate synthase beta subunit-like oxidoreductase